MASAATPRRLAPPALAVTLVLLQLPLGEAEAGGRGDRRPPEFRSIEGTGNHRDLPEMNAADTPLLRVLDPDYADGVSAMAGPDRPGARAVSNRVCDQSEPIENPLGTSDFLWQWGQFIDHDIDLTGGAEQPEPAHIPVPPGDPYFDPDATGDVEILFQRSLHDGEPPPGEVREQVNQITGWLDASQVYGSDPERAAALRTLDGTGELRTGPGDLLPDDHSALGNADGGSPEVMFLAGDVRANEQVGLTAMHTLFVREHNRIARVIRRHRRGLDGDQIYQYARRYVGAIMQAITYEEFLPALLGPRALRAYGGYDEGADARIANSFSTAAFRFGHSALSPNLLRLDRQLEPTSHGPLPLRDAFFSPDRIRFEGGIEPLLRGLAHQRHQRIDRRIVDEVRNFLFGQPGQGGFDLAALNLQRGRDHGLPSYAAAREAYGLRPVRDFSDISGDPETQEALESAYGTVDRVDLWIGGLSEDPLPNGHLGPLFAEVVAEQFLMLRDGDRFWYERVLPRDEARRVRSTRLSDVIRRNTDIGREIPDDVFRVRRSSGDSRDSRDGDGSRRRYRWRSPGLR